MDTRFRSFTWVSLLVLESRLRSFEVRQFAFRISFWLLIREIAGFKRTLISTGQTAAVSITLARKDMSIWFVHRSSFVGPHN